MIAGGHRRCFLLLVFFLLTGYGYVLTAQDENNVRLYTTGDGLSDNNITSLGQDSYGYIWIATLRGLNRYDGKHFLQFHVDKNNNSIQDESVFQLEQFDGDRLFACTGMGLHIINTLTNKRDNIIIPAPNSKFLYKYNSIRTALFDKDGSIYVLAKSGFYHFDAHYKLIFRFDYYHDEQIETEEFQFGSQLNWLSPHEILLYSIDGGYIYNTTTKHLYKLKGDEPYFPGPLTNYIVRQSGPGKFIFFKIGTDSITYVDIEKKRKIVSLLAHSISPGEFNWRTKLFHLSDLDFYVNSQLKGFFKLHIDTAIGKISINPYRYFPDYTCTDLIIDKENRLWVATNKGLIKQITNNTSVSQKSFPEDILKQSPGISIRNLLCYKNKLYVVCAGNGGLLVFNKKDLSFIKRISFRKYGLIPENFFEIIQGHGDTLFIGADGDLLWLKAETEETGEVKLDTWDKVHNWVSCLFKDHEGNIWMTSNENSKIYKLSPGVSAFQRLNFDEGIFKKLLRTHKIGEDQQGNIWMSGHGVSRLNKMSGKVELYLDSFPYIRFPRRDITAICFDKNNTLWLAIYNNGLAGYNIKNGTFQHITTAEGLPDNLIKALYPLNDKLWIATANGMACFDITTKKVSRFSDGDGFSLLPVSSTNLFYDHSSHSLYSGFTNRIIRFDPDSLLNCASAPSLFIESIRFANDTAYYFPEETIKKPYYKNDITVSVNGINYDDASNQRIHYRIANTNDTSWRLLTGDLINFNNLSPGNYRLQVRLSAANNRWQPQVKELNFIITPPFRQTPWFFVLVALLLFGLVYTIYFIRVSIIRNTERTKAQVQELKAEEYKERLELEKISNYFSSSFSNKKNVDEVLWDVASNLGKWMKYVDCMIYIWNEDKSRMIQKAGHGPKGTPEAISQNVFDVVPGQGVVGYVMQTKEPVLINDTRLDKRYRPDEMFRLSEICVPIIVDGELIGVIDSEHPEANYYKERELKILTTIATLVGNKIKQVEAEQSLAVKRHELASINEQLAEAQMNALQAQMNPHFIFNALNSIKRMILDNETMNASKYLSKFALMIRLTLNHSRVTFVTLQETIEYLQAYLGMEQLRFGSSFCYKIETTGCLDEEEINIPTLMIQPLAENAIWHGLMPKEGEKKLMIRFLQTGDFVTCIIEDNGIGILRSEKMNQLNKRPHVGLENLRNRIKIMNEKYDMNCTLDITDLGENNVHRTGTLATLRFKILTL